MCLRCLAPYVLKKTRRMRVHRPRMKPSGGCQSFCLGFWAAGEKKQRLWLIKVCIVHLLWLFCHSNRRTLYLYVCRCVVLRTQTQRFTQKREVELISTPPLSCVCPIHCHIITLCMIILLNLSRIKHASHKEHIYMLMPVQYSAERRDLTSKKSS